VIAALVAKTKIPADRIDEVVLGCANQAGEDNRKRRPHERPARGCRCRSRA